MGRFDGLRGPVTEHIEPPARRMPAEWEPHDATWIAWPHATGDWPGRFGGIRWTYAEIVRRLAESERVEILVEHPHQERSARRTLRDAGVPLDPIRFHTIPTDRGWLRDSAPTFVHGGPGQVGSVRRLIALHWKFTAWAKYDNWRLDRSVPPRIGRAIGATVLRPRYGRRWISLEGGAFDVDGTGSVLATEECLLSPEQARNPGFTRSAYETVFRRYLGARRTIWIPRGIVGDDTHGHIDDIARFVGPGRVLLVRCDRAGDPDRAASEAARSALESSRTLAGGRLAIEDLPCPQPVVIRGQRLPASYANFYIANRTVLVPTFDDPADAEALAVLQRAFPQRTVVGIRARDLVWGLGTIHCLTQQQPRSAP
ncbi:MAG: agmatine deiminase family protein [Thermoplasmata archaeon]